MRDPDYQKTIAYLFLLLFVSITVLALPSAASAQLNLGKLHDIDRDRSIPEGHIRYVVFVKTSDIVEAGTDSSIFLTFHGDGKRKTKLLTLNKAGKTSTESININTTNRALGFRGGDMRVSYTVQANDGSTHHRRTNMFERNTVTRVNIIAEDVGNVTSLTIKKDNWGSAPDWKLEYIDVVANGNRVRFNADKWFSSDSDTHTFKSSGPMHETEYKLETYTGNLTGAGTDSNIFLTIEGVDIDLRPLVLPEIRLNGFASGNLFERHQIDTINLGQLIFLREISKITIRSDNNYAGSAWFLGWIKLSVGTRIFDFTVNDWIESGKLTKVLTPKKEAPSKENTAQSIAQCSADDWIGTWSTTGGKFVIADVEQGNIRGAFEDGRAFAATKGEAACSAWGSWKDSAGKAVLSVITISDEKRSFSGSFRSSNGDEVSDWNGTKLSNSVSLPKAVISNTNSSPVKQVCAATDWVGTWKTTLFPEMTIKLEFGKGYTGVFSPANYPFTANIEGNACVIKGFWKDEKGVTVGAFRFTMSDKGNFAGAYVGRNDLNQDLSSKPQTWRGNKVGVTSAAASTTYEPNIPVPAPSAIPVNLSVGKFARQSSVDFGGVASRAVDGNTDGNWYNNSVTHTVGENGGWWEVDLGAVYDISEIKLYNRTDCCGDRLQKFRISVSNQPFSSNADGIEYAPLQVDVTTNPWVFRNSTQARYVRIYLNGSGVLSLAEVQVLGTPIN